MSRAEKRLEAMRRNPAGDWTIEDVKVVCRAYGVACGPPASGSHYDVSHPDQPDILTIPFRRPIKPVYIRKLIAFIDRMKG
ncbi:type II toxin-antitoxin system HicA family toxin [Methylobacterium sp. EM32]|uniref:type II toxin-antitoxin system HicA family toxin n=1 Tax=Methylobacterium sp. EM32 TaxID=3163481 RepID=UPI0033B2C185